MAKSQQTYNKKEREKKRLKKREEKLKRKEERKNESSGGSLENMMAYVDEFGNITDTPPDPNKKKKQIKASNIEIGVPKKTDEPNIERKGKVASFNHDKGYGFITDANSNEQFFVHMSDLSEPVDQNDKVSFKTRESIKGTQAVEVKKL